LGRQGIDDWVEFGDVFIALLTVYWVCGWV